MFSLVSDIASWWVARQKARAEMMAKAFGFFVDNLKWIIPLVLIVLAILWVRNIINERDEALENLAIAKAALQTYKDNVERVAKEQKTLVDKLREDGKQNIANIEAQHIKDIQHIAKLYGKELTNGKTAINHYRNELANRLLERKDNGNGASAMPENDQDRPASADCDATIARERTLMEAGAICASDYNICKAYVDSEQKRIGVE